MKVKQLTAVALASLMAFAPVLSQAQGVTSGSGAPLTSGSGAPVLAGAGGATGGASGMTAAAAGTAGMIAVVGTVVMAGAARNSAGGTGTH